MAKKSVSFSMSEQMFDKMSYYLEHSGMSKQAFLESVIGNYLTTFFWTLDRDIAAFGEEQILGGE